MFRVIRGWSRNQTVVIFAIKKFSSSPIPFIAFAQRRKMDRVPKPNPRCAQGFGSTCTCLLAWLSSVFDFMLQRRRNRRREPGQKKSEKNPRKSEKRAQHRRAANEKRTTRRQAFCLSGRGRGRGVTLVMSGHRGSLKGPLRNGIDGNDCHRLCHCSVAIGSPAGPLR
ncbi:hypothetical protein GGS23DRAFT_563978 [Durotheca rogersii]|uniref:uncharacterized protein n=1 Tax=Durotheca rogersii TaxID=419775 RepID=UPI00221F30DB|nr:uncharacterized protein GGS23DRAFT_563978 [Durotheca rogersii]KAI5864352.1 hypothetical protein GGS23DRAFT_563978 [Durotheca rogersii]